MIYETIFDIEIKIPDGLEYCWIRYCTNSHTDIEYIDKTIANGWMPVSPDSQLELVDHHFIMYKHDKNFEFIIKNIRVIDGMITSNGVVLCERNKIESADLRIDKTVQYLINKGVEIHNQNFVEECLRNVLEYEKSGDSTRLNIIYDNKINVLELEASEEDRIMFNFDKIDELKKEADQ